MSISCQGRPIHPSILPSTNPPYRKFTPVLVDFYNKQNRLGAAFELVFVSSDRSEDDMADYMSEYDMIWPAFAHG